MLKRLRLAWRFRVWPWRVPAEAVQFLSLQPPTPADIARTDALAAIHGWRRG